MSNFTRSNVINPNNINDSSLILEEDSEPHDTHRATVNYQRWPLTIIPHTHLTSSFSERENTRVALRPNAVESYEHRFFFSSEAVGDGNFGESSSHRRPYHDSSVPLVHAYQSPHTDANDDRGDRSLVTQVHPKLRLGAICNDFGDVHQRLRTPTSSFSISNGSGFPQPAPENYGEVMFLGLQDVASQSLQPQPPSPLLSSHQHSFEQRYQGDDGDESRLAKRQRTQHEPTVPRANVYTSFSTTRSPPLHYQTSIYHEVDDHHFRNSQPPPSATSYTTANSEAYSESWYRRDGAFPSNNTFTSEDTESTYSGYSGSSLDSSSTDPSYNLRAKDAEPTSKSSGTAYVDAHQDFASGNFARKSAVFSVRNPTPSKGGSLGPHRSPSSHLRPAMLGANSIISNVIALNPPPNPIPSTLPLSIQPATVPIDDQFTADVVNCGWHECRAEFSRERQLGEIDDTEAQKRLQVQVYEHLRQHIGSSTTCQWRGCREKGTEPVESGVAQDEMEIEIPPEDRRVFGDIRNLRRHIISSHIGVEHVCGVGDCDKSFNRASALQRHWKTCKGERKATKCGKRKRSSL